MASAIEWYRAHNGDPFARRRPPRELPSGAGSWNGVELWVDHLDICPGYFSDALLLNVMLLNKGPIWSEFFINFSCSQTTEKLPSVVICNSSRSCTALNV